MIRDAGLKFAANNRPGNSLAAARIFYPFTDGSPSGGNYTYLPLATLMDLGRGNTLTARMDVRESFASTDASITAALGVWMADTADALTNGTLVTCGVDILLAGMAAGNFYELDLPGLSTVGTLSGGGALQAGRLYVFLGLVINTTITAGNALFSAGRVDATLQVGSPGENIRYKSGFTA